MYYPKFFKLINAKVIAEDALKEGFQVTLITDEANFIYKPHTHPEAKYLAFVSGSMKVVVGTQSFLCESGDKLIIPGNTVHSAIVGPDGCDFYWSEKVLR